MSQGVPPLGSVGWLFTGKGRRTQAYPMGLRERVLAACGEAPATEGAELFSVSASWARSLRRRFRETGEAGPRRWRPRGWPGPLRRRGRRG